MLGVAVVSFAHADELGAIGALGPLNRNTRRPSDLKKGAPKRSVFEGARERWGSWLVDVALVNVAGGKLATQSSDNLGRWSRLEGAANWSLKNLTEPGFGGEKGIRNLRFGGNRYGC